MVLNILINFILWCNFLQSIIMIILTIIIGIAAFVSLYIARKSLKIAHRSFRETEKMRRDTFLPIVIANNPISRTTGAYTNKIGIGIKNIGQWQAFEVSISVTGIKQTAKVIHLMDVNQTKEFEFGLTNAQLYTDLLSEPKLIIEYYDVFKRRLETVYKIIQKKTREAEKDVYIPKIDLNSYDVNLSGKKGKNANM